MKQSFLFLPNENPKRTNIVPQEDLILNDDSLLQEDIPKGISDPLPPNQPIASQPLGDCEKSCSYAIAEKDFQIMNCYSLFRISFQSLQKKYKRTQKNKSKTFKKTNK